MSPLSRFARFAFQRWGLAAARNALYEEVADLVFDSDGLAVGNAADRVCSLVESRWQHGEAA